MKRISFKDSQGLSLTQMVLTGRKTMTRRNTRMYEIGDVVAIQQSYKDVLACEHLSDDKEDEVCRLVSDGVPGCTNKMFVRADLMPHHIRITDARCERLQDISDEDCLREGVKEESKYPPIRYVYRWSIDQDGDVLSSHWCSTPREAFAYLIDKVSGRGTWDKNPMVFVYEFELVD